MVTRRNCEGVLLRYSLAAPARYPLATGGGVTDRQRNALIAAEKELRVLEIIVEFLGVSEIGVTRIHDALRIIGRGMELKRPSLGLQRPRRDV